VGALLRHGIQAIQVLRGADPQLAVAILEESGDEDPFEAIVVLRVVNEDLELVSVEAIEAELGSEPQEAPVVLDDLGYPGLRQAVFRGKAREARSERSTTGSASELGTGAA
jgi:hypothetical protein